VESQYGSGEEIKFAGLGASIAKAIISLFKFQVGIAPV
jgi:hypothetical protein